MHCVDYIYIVLLLISFWFIIFFQKCCFFILKLDDCPAEFKDDVSAWDHQKNPTLPPLDVMTDLSMAHFLSFSFAHAEKSNIKTYEFTRKMHAWLNACLADLNQPTFKKAGGSSVSNFDRGWRNPKTFYSKHVFVSK